MLPYTPFLYDTENVKETLERTNRVTKSSMQKALFHLKEVDIITASISQRWPAKMHTIITFIDSWHHLTLN